jgi:hypothetical protein
MRHRERRRRKRLNGQPEMKSNNRPRYMVFPANSEEDGRNWIVRDTKNAAKPEDGKVVQAFRVLNNAIKEATRLNHRHLHPIKRR